MTELNNARKNLYRTMEVGKGDEILEASRKLDELILRHMQHFKYKNTFTAHESSVTK